MSDPCDPFFDDVSLLLSCDGVDASTSFPDTSSNALVLTNTGGLPVSTVNPKFGTGCMWNPFGASQYLSYPIVADGPLDIGDGDFTIEGWFRLDFATSYIPFFSFGAPGSNALRMFRNNSALTVQNLNTGWDDVSNGGHTFVLGTWYHFAVCRSGSQAYLFLDGVQDGTGPANWTGTPLMSPEMRLGTDYQGSFMLGALDEVRVTKGVARYTADFTPPSAPFPVITCSTPADVPDVVGETLADATTDIEAALLVVGSVTYEFSSTVDINVVISQNPIGGTTISEGDAVNLVVSLGDSAIVPDVVGLDQPAATIAIMGAAFAVGSISAAYDEGVPLGLVISQTPVAGTEAAVGSDVDIVLSLGPTPVTVPNVVNASLADAALILDSVGLTVGALSNAFSDEIAAGHVVSQSPFAGSTVSPGTSVNLVISLGPAAVTVPDVVGLTSSVAADVLRAAGLRVGRITVDTSGATPLGLIASQFANAGALVAHGTKIALVLSAIAPPFDVSTTVISQYAQSPTLVELVENMAEYIDPRTNLTEFYAYVWNVDTATGFGLDVWGKIVGVGRLLRIVADDPIFGFDNASTPPPDWQPWSQGRFARNTGEGGEAVILPDDAYRVLVLTKALANIAATNAASINQLLKNLFPGRGKAFVEDLGGMAMRFVFDFALTPVEYAIVSQSGALPHPAGVSLSVSVPP